VHIQYIKIILLVSFFTVRLFNSVHCLDILFPLNEPNILFLMRYYMHLSPKGKLADDTYYIVNIRKLSVVEGVK
jgi:hypothetical protein